MRKSGLADSPFFQLPPKKAVTPPPVQVPAVTKEPAPKPKRKNDEPKQPRHHDTMQPSNHDTVIPRYHDGIIESVRKAVKELGKEAATHRFTEEEKKAIVDIIYAYKGQGIRTSENEIARIAVNFLIEDHRENGENSILHQVLKALKE